MIALDRGLDWVSSASGQMTEIIINSVNMKAYLYRFRLELIRCREPGVNLWIIVMLNS